MLFRIFRARDGRHILLETTDRDTALIAAGQWWHVHLTFEGEGPAPYSMGPARGCNDAETPAWTLAVYEVKH
jgi:hypothetical protein